MVRSKALIAAGAAVLLVGGAAAAVALQSGGQDERKTAAAIQSAPQTASDIESAFRKVPLPIIPGKTLDAASDPNELLGRPGQYTSKVFFTDARHADEGDEPLEQNTIEVFKSEADATKRREYIEAVTGSTPMFAEYTYQRGPVLVRLSRVLLPDEAGQYEAALAKVVR